MQYAKLLPEHAARIPEWVERWIRVGHCTDEADWAESEAAIRECYAMSGLAPPTRYVRVQSPLVLALAGPIAARMLQRSRAVGRAVDDAVDDAVGRAVYDAVGRAVGDAVDGAVRGAVGRAVDGAVYDAVGRAVGDAVDDAVRDAVGRAVDGAVYDAVGRAVGDAVDGAVRGAVGDAVDDAVRDAVGRAVDGAVYDAVGRAVGDAVDGAVRGAVRGAVDDAVRDGWYRYLGGQMRAWWMAYESFFDEVCGVQHPRLREARAYRRAQSASFWWWPHVDFVMVCNRPELIAVEQRGTRWMLHNDSGPSIRFRDGWSLWHIDGLAVDEQIVMRPETQTITQINAEQNNDVRAVRIRRFGISRYLLESGAEVIDECSVEIEGTHEALLRTTHGTYLWPTCPSGKECPPLRVPGDITTCESARRWLASDKDVRLCIGRT